MKTVGIHEAKTHLSRLVDEAARGEAFVIAKSGRPMVKVVAVDAVTPAVSQRIGFMREAIRVPDDFDIMGQDQIEAAFGRGWHEPAP